MPYNTRRKYNKSDFRYMVRSYNAKPNLNAFHWEELRDMSEEALIYISELHTKITNLKNEINSSDSSDKEEASVVSKMYDLFRERQLEYKKQRESNPKNEYFTGVFMAFTEVVMKLDKLKKEMEENNVKNN